MPAFQFYDPAPSFRDLLGDQVLNGGSLTFYDRGTTNPRDTWSAPEMEVADLNANPLTLDSAGRPGPLFGDGEYTVVCKDSLGATIWTRDVIPGGGAAASLPTLDSGEFLTGDGTNYLAQTIRQMPDATGSTGQIPVTNGGGANGYTLQDIPDFTPPDPEIAVTSTTFQAGVSTDDTKYWIERGTGSAPNSGTKFTSTTITFAEEFDALWHVDICVTTTSTTPAGELPTHSVTGFTAGSSATGVTVNFNIPDDDSSTNHKFSTSVPFTWMAHGSREMPA
jgi:hypothetical protein